MASDKTSKQSMKRKPIRVDWEQLEDAFNDPHDELPYSPVVLLQNQTISSPNPNEGVHSPLVRETSTVSGWKSVVSNLKK